MKPSTIIAGVIACFTLVLRADVAHGQVDGNKTPIPYQENWDKVIDMARGASTIYYRGLCLYKSHISEIECKGAKAEVKEVVAFLAKQKFVGSRCEDRVPLPVGIGGGVRFYDEKGNQILRVFYMVNDWGIDLDEKHRIMFTTIHRDVNTFFSDEEELPFVSFGKIAEKDGWKGHQVYRKMKEIGEYRNSRKGSVKK
jgi:hypothetical protein